MTDSGITQDQFLRIAKLSQLSINPGEEFIKDQLSQAAGYVDILKELDTDKIDPTYQVNHKKNVFRADVVEPSFTQDQALSQAPLTDLGFIKTAATIKK